MNSQNDSGNRLSSPSVAALFLPVPGALLLADQSYMELRRDIGVSVRDTLATLLVRGWIESSLGERYTRALKETVIPLFVKYTNGVASGTIEARSSFAFEREWLEGVRAGLLLLYSAALRDNEHIFLAELETLEEWLLFVEL